MAEDEKNTSLVHPGGYLNPDAVIAQLGIAPGMKIADFGSGSGIFALKMAKKVGNAGKVYAIDVLPTAMESVRSQAKLQGIYNIEPVRADLEVPGSCGLADGSCHLVFLANILFQSVKKAEIVAEAKRVLKPGGSLVFIEWRPEAKIGGPAGNRRISPEAAKNLAESQGFKTEREFAASANHYGLIFKK